MALVEPGYWDRLEGGVSCLSLSRLAPAGRVVLYLFSLQ
jgi:hypothetical protein